MIFDRAPAGYSLTQEPKGTPFQNPPEINDPEEAAMYHLDKMNNVQAFEDIGFFLEEGIPIPTLVQGITRGAVMAGIHSIDVSLIIAPVLHEFIKDVGDVMGVTYDEGLEDPEARARQKYRRDVARADRMLKRLKVDVKETFEEGEDIDQDTKEQTDEMMIVAKAEVKEPETDMPKEESMPEEKSMGLMSRSMG